MFLAEFIDFQEINLQHIFIVLKSSVTFKYTNLLTSTQFKVSLHTSYITPCQQKYN